MITVLIVTNFITLALLLYNDAVARKERKVLHDRLMARNLHELYQDRSKLAPDNKPANFLKAAIDRAQRESQ